MPVCSSCCAGENPRCDRQNLIRFFEVVFRAEQPNIRGREAASAFGKWNVMIEVTIVRQAVTQKRPLDFGRHRGADCQKLYLMRRVPQPLTGFR